MKQTHSVHRAAALVLSMVLALCAPLSLAVQAETPSQTETETEIIEQTAGDTIGGASTALDPVEEYWLSDDETNGLFSGLFGSSDTITVKYLYVKGKGLQTNVRLNLTDCLVGITYNELGGINSFVSSSAAAEAWRAQAIAIHSYLEYHNQYGSSANALTYIPVSDIPSSTKQALYNAIEPVANYVLVYGSGSSVSNYQVCDAVFSASAGYNTQTGVYGTCSGKDAWGHEVSYLQSVESKYERTYHEKMRRIIGKDYTYVEYNDSKYPDEPYESADTTHKSLGGYVLYNTLVSNGRKYTYINQFASSRYCFDFGQDEDGVNVMTYYGWGHGVGMSQCGAVGYAAEEGYTYRQILKKYYTGTALLDVKNNTLESMDGGAVSGGSGFDIFWLFKWILRLFGLL